MTDRSFAVSVLAGIFALACGLGGCTVGPDYVRPEVKLPAAWTCPPTPTTQPEADCQWWKGFNDPVLDELVRLARCRNLTLEIAALRIAEARAALGIAVGLQFPQQQELFGGLTGADLSRNAPHGGLLADRPFYDYQVGFDMGWELDLWGRYRRGVQAASADFRAAVADYHGALVSLTAEVARTYALYRTSGVLIELARENINIQENGLKMAEARFRNGATTELDVTQARTLLESTRASVPRLQTTMCQAVNALNTLLGEPPGVIDAVLTGPMVIPTAPADPALGVPADLLRRRPDIRTAELESAAQAARVGVAETDLYPRLALFGQIGFETSSGGSRLKSSRVSCTNLFDGDSLFYAWGPSFSWPVLNYGQLKNNVRVQDARLQQLLVNYQNTVIKAAGEVEDALIEFVNARQAEVFQQKAVAAAKKSVALSTAQYRAGAVDYQRVLDSQRSLLQEQDRLADTQFSIATGWIAVYKALGGGWELHPSPMIPAATQDQMRKRTDWDKLLPPALPETLEPPPTPVVHKPDW